MKGRPSSALSPELRFWWLKWLEPPRRERRPHLMLAVGPPPFTDRLWDVFALACKGELMKPARQKRVPEQNLVAGVFVGWGSRPGSG